jgi:hypothetical protein
MRARKLHSVDCTSGQKYNPCAVKFFSAFPRGLCASQLVSARSATPQQAVKVRSTGCLFELRLKKKTGLFSAVLFEAGVVAKLTGGDESSLFKQTTEITYRAIGDFLC